MPAADRHLASVIQFHRQFGNADDPAHVDDKTLMTLNEPEGFKLTVFVLKFSDAFIVCFRCVDKDVTVIGFQVQDTAIFQHIAGVSPLDKVTPAAVFPDPEGTFKILPEILFLYGLKEKLKSVLTESVRNISGLPRCSAMNLIFTGRGKKRQSTFISNRE